MKKGVPIRSVSRALEVLRIINHHGAPSMMEISKRAGIPYPTANRIVKTLIAEHFVECENDRKRYRPTVLVQSLANGYKDYSGIVEISRPHLEAVTRDLHWPVSLCTRVGEKVVIRDCTHSISPLTLDTYYPGTSLPLLESASGQVYLSFCEEEERIRLMDALPQSGVPFDPWIAEQMRNGERPHEIREAGYVISGSNKFTTTPGRTTSIAVPIFSQDKLVAALALVCFASSLKLEIATESYIPRIKEATRLIGEDLSNAELHKRVA